MIITKVIHISLYQTIISFLGHNSGHYCLSKNERKYYDTMSNSIIYLTKRVSTKRAFSLALGKHLTPDDYKEITLCSDYKGAPQIRLSRPIWDSLYKSGINKLLVSISDEANIIALCVAILHKIKNGKY